MAKFSFTQNTLAAGEISKSAWGESSQEHYANGCEKLKNVLLSKDGVQQKRLGSINVTPILPAWSFSHPKNSPARYSKYARIFPVSFQAAGGVQVSYLIIVEPKEIGWELDGNSNIIAITNPEFHPDTNEDSHYGIKILDLSTNIFLDPDISDVKTWLANEPAIAWSGFSLAELRSAKHLQIENSLILYSPNSVPCVITIDPISFSAQILTWWSAVSIRAIPVDKIDYSFASGSTLPDKIKEGKGESFYWLATPYRDLFPSRKISFSETTVGTDKSFTVDSDAGLILHKGTFIKVIGSSTGYAVIESYNPATKSGKAKILVAIPSSDNPFHVGLMGLNNTPAGLPGRGDDSSSGVDEFLFPINSMVFFENRLVIGMGGAIAGSQVQSYGEFDFTGDASNDRPFFFRILNSKPSFIKWMVAGKELRIGTGENELLTHNPDSTLGLGLATVSFNVETYNGSTNRRPVEYGGNIIFVGKDRKTPLMQFFNRDQSAYRIANLLALSEDLFKRSYEQGRDLDFESLDDGISVLAAPPDRLIYTRDPWARFALRAFSSDPEVYEMTMQTSAETMWLLDTYGCLYSAKITGTDVSWSHHVLGGTRNEDEAPSVRSICSVPDPVFGSDSLFMLVERKINGSSLVTIEKFIDPSRAPKSNPSLPYVNDYPAEDDEAPNGGPYGNWLLYNAYYVYPRLNAKNILYANAYMDNCTFLGSGVPTTKFGKLDWPSGGGAYFSEIAHLEGETVQVFSEGFYIGDFVVTNGEITLPKAYPWVIVGLKYEAEIIPVPPQFGALDGSSEGHKRRIHAATVRFHRTLDAKMGPNGEDNQVQEINFRPAGLAASEPTPFFNGLKQVQGFGNYGLEGSVRIVSDKPYPMGVVCVNFKGQVNEG